MSEALARLRENVEPLLIACRNHSLNPVDWVEEADTTQFVSNFDAACAGDVGFAMGYMTALSSEFDQTVAELLATVLTEDEIDQLLDWTEVHNAGGKVRLLSHCIHVYNAKDQCLLPDGTWTDDDTKYTALGTGYAAHKAALELAKKALFKKREGAFDACGHRIKYRWHNITGFVTPETLESDAELRARAMIAQDSVCGELRHKSDIGSADGWWEIDGG